MPVRRHCSTSCTPTLYGKSWKTDLGRMGGKKDMRNPCFVIGHGGDLAHSLVTRSSDS